MTTSDNLDVSNNLSSGELDRDSVVSILETTASDDKKYKTKFFNLDAIIAVGYRVNSYEAFRTQRDREYISDFDREVKRIKGRIDDQRKGING